MSVSKGSLFYTIALAIVLTVSLFTLFFISDVQAYITELPPGHTSYSIDYPATTQIIEERTINLHIHTNGTMTCSCIFSDLILNEVLVLLNGDFRNNQFLFLAEMNGDVMVGDETIHGVVSIFRSESDILTFYQADTFRQFTNVDRFTILNTTHFSAGWGAGDKGGNILVNDNKAHHHYYEKQSEAIIVDAWVINDVHYRLGDTLDITNEKLSRIPTGLGDYITLVEPGSHIVYDQVVTRPPLTPFPPNNATLFNEGILIFVDPTFDVNANTDNLNYKIAEYTSLNHDISTRQATIARHQSSIDLYLEYIALEQAPIDALNLEIAPIQTQADTVYAQLTVLDPVNYPDLSGPKE